MSKNPWPQSFNYSHSNPNHASLEIINIKYRATIKKKAQNKIPSHQLIYLEGTQKKRNSLKKNRHR